ncbi:hypothetical protein IGI73_003351 [Enterococcus sp. DIV0755f]
MKIEHHCPSFIFKNGLEYLCEHLFLMGILFNPLQEPI